MNAQLGGATEGSIIKTWSNQDRKPHTDTHTRETIQTGEKAVNNVMQKDNVKGETG